MRVLLTGGSGDLGQMLCSSLMGMGYSPVVLDVTEPSPDLLKDRTDGATVNVRSNSGGASHVSSAVPVLEFFQGSILDRTATLQAMKGADIVVHIAAWHGIHEVRGQKSVYDFWDLNVSGTFNVFQAAAEQGLKSVIFISSTSIDEPYTVYGHSKVLGEEIAGAYAHRHAMNVITLRPRAFIPPWNRAVYASFIEWAQWFSKGAVHISDVAQSVIKSIELLQSGNHALASAPVFLTVDGAYQYTDDDLANWDVDGPASTFNKYYKPFYDLAVSVGLEPSRKPTKLDISETERLINYRPLYSMKTLLLELKMYGAAGPYAEREKGSGATIG
jgi:UDP-glucose 4-epimerase